MRGVKNMNRINVSDQFLKSALNKVKTDMNLKDDHLKKHLKSYVAKLERKRLHMIGISHGDFFDCEEARYMIDSSIEAFQDISFHETDIFLKLFALKVGQAEIMWEYGSERYEGDYKFPIAKIDIPMILHTSEKEYQIGGLMGVLFDTIKTLQLNHLSEALFFCKFQESFEKRISRYE
jgi:hypothetical protein